MQCVSTHWSRLFQRMAFDVSSCWLLAGAWGCRYRHIVPRSSHGGRPVSSHPTIERLRTNTSCGRTGNTSCGLRVLRSTDLSPHHLQQTLFEYSVHLLELQEVCGLGMLSAEDAAPIRRPRRRGAGANLARPHHSDSAPSRPAGYGWAQLVGLETRSPYNIGTLVRSSCPPPLPPRPGFTRDGHF